MDRRTTVALVLCMLVFALFTALQARFTPKPKLKPPVAATAPAAGLDTAFRAAPGAPATPATTAAGSPIAAAPATPAVTPRSVVIETPLYRATFSNIGARLQSFELKRYAAAWGRSRFGDNPGRRPKHGALVPEGDRVELRGAPAFAFDLGSGPALRSLASTAFAVEESTTATGETAAVTFVTDGARGLVTPVIFRALTVFTSNPRTVIIFACR